MEITAQVNAFPQEALHLFNTGFEHPRPDAVRAVGHTIFKNINELVKSSGSLHGPTQTFGKASPYGSSIPWSFTSCARGHPHEAKTFRINVL